MTLSKKTGPIDASKLDLFRECPKLLDFCYVIAPQIKNCGTTPIETDALNALKTQVASFPMRESRGLHLWIRDAEEKYMAEINRIRGELQNAILAERGYTDHIKDFDRISDELPVLKALLETNMSANPNIQILNEQLRIMGELSDAINPQFLEGWNSRTDGLDGPLWSEA